MHVYDVQEENFASQLQDIWVICILINQIKNKSSDILVIYLLPFFHFGRFVKSSVTTLTK